MTDQHEPEFLTTAEFLQRNAGRIRRDALYRYIADGSIPHVRLGGKGSRVLIPENALALMMEQQRASSRIGARTDLGTTGRMR